jgi:hypothetical protein
MLEMEMIAYSCTSVVAVLHTFGSALAGKDERKVLFTLIGEPGGQDNIGMA